MRGLRILIFIFCTIISATANSQVKIRLFSSQTPESVVFSVTEGSYEINTFNSAPFIISAGNPVFIAKYEGMMAVKSRGKSGIVCDSVDIRAKTDNDVFSLRVSMNGPVKQYYSGDLFCHPDMGSMVLLNNCDIEKYITGVVRAEGGSGKHKEYFKTQAVIARTYMYRYKDKHISDKYNVCDDVHCQAFNGLSSDSLINAAVIETHGQVILAPDSTLIISAFHSNCGGETSFSENVWLTSQPYLKRVVDPYCLYSRNAQWEKSISVNDWVKMLRKSGYDGLSDDPATFSFRQKSRLIEYKTGIFTMPLTTIRAEMNLRSAFFSVVTDGDSLLIRGRGYGHGVGLCQEGAMEMANRGFSYQKIIDYYYSGVIISDIKNAVILLPDE
jgi:stage II sporulation protein D (peptidoglycan lytic transglycosylase)